MVNGKSGSQMDVGKEEWEHIPTETKLWMIFSTMGSINKRLQALENKSRYDKCWSFLGGVLGGAAAALGIKVGT